jgi:hypothetical protein
MTDDEPDTLADSLDWYRRCEFDGCEWKVRFPATICLTHGGPPVPQFYEGGDDHAIIATKHMPRGYFED